MTHQEAAISAILEARDGSVRLAPDPLSTAATDADSAYAVQRAVAARMPANLGPVAGYKIGMSTLAAQRQKGLGEAIFGRIYRSRLHASGERLTIAADRRIGLEVEIGARLARDLPAADRPVDPAELEGAIASWHPSIELLEDRFVDSARAPLWALAADDMLGMGGVLGAPIAGFDARAAHAGRLVLDGRTAATGSSAELAGGTPLFNIAWLANRLAGMGLELRAGDVILTGGLNAPLWLTPEPGASTAIEARLDEHLTTFAIDWTG